MKSILVLEMTLCDRDATKPIRNFQPALPFRVPGLSPWHLRIDLHGLQGIRKNFEPVSTVLPSFRTVSRALITRAFGYNLSEELLLQVRDQWPQSSLVVFG